MRILKDLLAALFPQRDIAEEIRVRRVNDRSMTRASAEPVKNSKGWIISGCPSHRNSTDANCIRVRDANLYPIEDAKILTAFEVAEAERDDSRQIAKNLLDEKCKALAERDQASAERDQASAEFEAGLKLMHEHMRQRDEMKTKLAAQSAMVAKLADYLETATGIIEEDAAGDEDDIADARNLISEARAL